MPKALEIGTELVQETFTAAINEYVGVAPGKMRPEDLEKLTGIDLRTIKAYRSGSSCPTLGKLARLMAVLPPDFTNRIIGIAGMGGSAPIEPGHACSLTVNAAAGALVAKIGEHLADDGRVDHREEAEQEKLVEQVHDMTGRWLARRRIKTGQAQPRTPEDAIWQHADELPASVSPFRRDGAA